MPPVSPSNASYPPRSGSALFPSIALPTRARCSARIHAHEDREWSASYAIGDDGLTVVMTCHALRCTFDTMLAGLGLPKGALTASKLTRQPWRAFQGPAFYGGRARSYHHDLMADAELVEEICTKLGCTRPTLVRYVVGIDREGRLTFPERDKDGDVIGYARHLPYWDERRGERHEPKTLSAQTGRAACACPIEGRRALRACAIGRLRRACYRQIGTSCSWKGRRWRPWPQRLALGAGGVCGMPSRSRPPAHSTAATLQHSPIAPRSTSWSITTRQGASMAISWRVNWRGGMGLPTCSI